jgi:D-alanyl-D-alanine carboxypeptidase
MKPTLVLLTFAAACSAGDPVDPCEPGSMPDNPEFQGMVQAYAREDNHLIGAILGVQPLEGAPWVGAVGQADLTGTPMSTCTRFRSGSIAKMALGIAAVSLVEDGAFGLDDPVHALLPDRQLPPTMTVRHLLNHTSGLTHPSEADLDYQLRILNNPERMRRMDHRERWDRFVEGRPLRFEPGTGSSYSNAGYWLLADLLEAADDRPWREVVADRVLAPAGMSSSRFDVDDGTIARGYRAQGARWVDTTAWDAADSEGDPAGGLHTNAPDLLALGAALFRGDLVNDASLVDMQETPAFPSCWEGDCGYGLGIESLRAYPTVGWGKNGSLLGADANLFVHPDPGFVVVLFTNQGGGSHKDAILGLWEEAEESR